MAISLRLAAPPTDQEILDLSRRNPGLQIEQAPSGELVLTPTGAESGRREVVLVAQLYQWARADGRGEVFGSSTGFRLPDGSLRSPDASWVRRERWEALSAAQREGFAPLCPDAVFEIRSRIDALRDLRAKMQAYLANGARLAVLLDPERRAVEVHEPDQDVRVAEPAGPVSLEPILPGFALDPAPIFS
ncbi:MAG: Uma2 family endonuclease [Armatimonadota bacterium]|nr:Uma2 family endonuclease [Armatimonadota bacterium]